MTVYDQFGRISTSAAITAGGTGATHSCGCVGPQNGEPYCPCRMRGVIERDGRWIEPERDLGAVRRYNGPKLLGTLADATPKTPNPGSEP